MNKSALCLSLTTFLGGCASMPANMPLVFGETITFGVGVSATTSDQGADFTLGFKSRDVAIIPVTVLRQDGGVERLQSSITNDAAPNQPKSTSSDAYSVIGQFESDTGEGGRKVGLGKFFATGAAAQVLAEGFRAKMENEAAPPASPAVQAPATK